jgi:phenylalanyl-tRNA synthetase beta subunit
VCAAEPRTAARLYTGAPYYQAREYLMTLLSEFGLAGVVTFKPFIDVDFGEHELLKQMACPFEPKRSAMVMNGDYFVGIVGEYTASVRAALKLPEWTAGFEIFGSAFKKAPGKQYQQLPRFPKITQDMSLKVSADQAYGELYAFLGDQLTQLKPEQTWSAFFPVDIYQRADDGQHKQVTFRLAIASFERTLRSEEVNNLLDAVAARAKERFGAERI